MGTVKLTGVKFPGYPTKEIARDLNNFLTTQGIFFQDQAGYLKEAARLGIEKPGTPTPIEILISIKDGPDDPRS
jgi:hypothetical protein